MPTMKKFIYNKKEYLYYEIINYITYNKEDDCFIILETKSFYNRNELIKMLNYYSILYEYGYDLNIIINLSEFKQILKEDGEETFKIIFHYICGKITDAFIEKK